MQKGFGPYILHVMKLYKTEIVSNPWNAIKLPVVDIEHHVVEDIMWVTIGESVWYSVLDSVWEAAYEIT